MIYEKFSLKKDLISKGVSGTLGHCERVAAVLNCDYREYVILVKEILVLISILRTYTNSYLNLVSD
jgi:hypothetical protein